MTPKENNMNNAKKATKKNFAPKVLGYDDETNTCDRCGRTNLKGTYIIETAVSGSMIALGSGCVAHQLEYTETEVTKYLSTELKKRKEEYEKECKKLTRKQYKGIMMINETINNYCTSNKDRFESMRLKRSELRNEKRQIEQGLRAKYYQ